MSVAPTMERSILDEPLLPMVDKWITDAGGLQRHVADATAWAQTRLPAVFGRTSPGPASASPAPPATPSSTSRVAIPLLMVAGVCAWCVLTNVLTTGLGSVALSLVGYLVAGAVGVVELAPPIATLLDKAMGAFKGTPTPATKA